MKILIYETREDELEAIRKLGKELPIEIQTTAEIPSLENVSMAEGCDGISILGQGRIDHCFWRLWQNLTFIIFLPGLSDTTILIWNMQKSWGSMYAMPAMPPMVSRTSPL